MSYRLFVALDLPDTAKDALSSLQMPMQGAAWVKPAGFHITLKFLGDGNDEARLEAAKVALARVEAAGFDYELRDVGRFPRNQRQTARVLWAAIQAPDELDKLAKKVDAAMVDTGFAPENRVFSPHITLARIKHGGNAGEIATFLEQHRGLHIAGLQATEFHLFSSQLSPQGATYTRMGSYLLK